MTRWRIYRTNAGLHYVAPSVYHEDMSSWRLTFI